MFKSHMLDNVKQSRYIPPIWLAVILSIVFVYGGEIVGGLALVPISILLGLVLGLVHSGAGFVMIQELISHYMIFIQLFLFSFISLALFLWVKCVEKRPFSSLGFFKENWFKELAKGFLIGAAQFSLIVVLLLVTGVSRLEPNHLSLEPFLFIIALIPFWILQGGTEELVTRGWLFPTVTAKSNILIGILISAGLFGALHLLNPSVTLLSIINIILDGIFACFYMLKTDNMWGLAGIHGAWNFVQGNIYGIQVSGQGAEASVFAYNTKSSVDWLSGGAFGAEGSIFTSLVLILGIFYLYWSLKKEDKLPTALQFRKSNLT